MGWQIGWLVEKILFYAGRFRARYQLHQFAAAGKSVYIENGCSLTASHIYAGNHVFIGENCLFLSTRARIVIGNHVMFGPRVCIVTGTHRVDCLGKLLVDVREEDKRPTEDADVIIEDDVWIGMGAMIWRGVHIGTGAVIGAGTLVTHDVPPYTIVTNKRTRREKGRFPAEELVRHQQLVENTFK